MIEIFFKDFFTYILPLYLLLTTLGLVSFPISKFIFKNSWDYGYANSQIISLLGISWISFVIGIFLSILNINFNFSIYTPLTLLATLFWLIINFFIYKKTKDNFKELNLSKIIYSSIFSFIFIIFFYFINSFNSTYSATGSEHHMNIGIMNTILYSNKLPPDDMWNSGNTLNYYYFGHYIFVTLSIFLNIEPAADSLFLGIIPGSLFVTASTIFVISILNSSDKNLSKRKITISLLLTFSFICLLNPVKSLYALNEYILGINPVEEIAKNYPFYSIRIIKNVIAENLNYPFLFNPLHALTVNLMTSVLILGTIFEYFKSNSKISVLNRYLLCIFILLGFSGLINTWDLISYFLITLFCILIYKFQDLRHNFSKNIKNLLLLLYPTILIITPWFYSFSSPGGAPGVVSKVSNIFELISFWGIYFVLYFILLFEFKKDKTKHNFSFFLASLAMLIIFFLEIIYFKDVMASGDFFRANTYYKFSNNAIFLFSIAYSIFLTNYLIESNKFFIKYTIVTIIILTFWLNYPMMLIKSGFDFKYTGINNQEKTVHKYSPELLELIQYLNSNKKPNQVIWEGTGEKSYLNSNFVSVFTGIPTVFGYPYHQFTWRATKNLIENVYERQIDTKEFFTGDNFEMSKNLVKKYSVDYVVISKSEKELYKNNLKEEKLKKLGEVVFEKGDTKLIKIIE
jgi:uncharacterized membrane protein